MQPPGALDKLDRHALVMAIWLSLGFVSVTLVHYGIGAGGAWAILAGFGILLAAFIGHVIVNAVYETMFTRGELALGLVLYLAGLVAFALAALLSETLTQERFLATGVGLIVLAAAILFYMITHFGMRRTFDAFDAISDFRTRADDVANGDER